ncbi:MAG: NrdH-redoxin [Candidatus Yanofskybacteria bacterium RIFCSPLOWO2_02_FULL_43_10b]|uniref:NrdH-redoxin n=1 Tax=Candidatus Yanofskybacteria bacterium RIFCSPLOWO2_02_FULL_43_10b TaxID=1802704 RepID=A0A1F8H0A3_9BACT|nr:MAG: NrdH-redoxin [Candidatus Yanofskybacteria bacterium RIFCSPLOWO2_02_FULL_43_10b]
MNQKIQIYTTPACPYCHMAKEYFKSKNLPYEEYDVLKDLQRRQEMVQESGQMGVPVIKIGGQVVIGFNKGKINELLDL